MWGGDVVYSADTFPEQLQSLTGYVTDPKADKDVHLIISIAYAAMFGATVCKNSAYYARPQPNPSVLEPFTPDQAPFEAYRTLRTDTVKGFADEQTKGSPPGQRWVFRLFLSFITLFVII